ncbi:MAG: ABC transporter substrate-binding protein [Bacteroidales bacterium]
MALPLHTFPTFERTESADQAPGSVPIGLLIPDSTQRGAILSAQMAIDAANEQGGMDGIPFRLVVRSSEGPWGAGSKESVSLVYDDNVVAIVGALDGRNGHLAEQVATKSHLVYLETRTTESTLSQAFVPYFMRVLPNDDQQSKAILKKIEEQNGGKVALIYDDEYDHLNAARSIARIAGREGLPEPLLLSLDSLGISPVKIEGLLRRSGVANLVIPYRSEITLSLLRHIRQSLPEITLYGTFGLITGLVPGDPSWQEMEGILIISPGYPPSASRKAFDTAFAEKAGHAPPVEAAYTYDGISMIIRAIRSAGTDREAVKNELSTLKYSGITGTIAFDEMGNRSSDIRFFQVRNGEAVTVGGDLR